MLGAHRVTEVGGFGLESGEAPEHSGEPGSGQQCSSFYASGQYPVRSVCPALHVEQLLSASLARTSDGPRSGPNPGESRQRGSQPVRISSNEML